MSTAYWLDPQGRFHRAGRHDTWASDATGIPDGTAASTRLLRAGWARVRTNGGGEIQVQAQHKAVAVRAAREAAAELAARGEAAWEDLGIVTEWAEPTPQYTVLTPEGREWNPARYRVIRLAPDPRRVQRWRMVRLVDGSLLRVAVVPGRGPRGGRTVAVARLVPMRGRRRNPQYRTEVSTSPYGDTAFLTVDTTTGQTAAIIEAYRRKDTTMVPSVSSYSDDPHALLSAFQTLRRTLPGPYLGSAVANERVYEMVKRLHERGLPVGVSSVDPALMRRGLKPFRNPRRKLSPLMLAALLIPGIPPF